MKNIILFDLDGTLIDSTDAIVSTFLYSFKQHNFEFWQDEEAIKNVIGYPLDIMFEKLGVSRDKCWDFVDTYKNRYRTICNAQTFLLNNAKQALQIAQSFSRMSVVTTKTAQYSIPLLKHMQIEHYFEHITGREHVTHPKPHAEPILRTLDLMQVDTSSYNIWMIGDTKLDLMAANSASINSVGVLCGYGKKEDLIHHSPHIVLDALEAVHLIKKMV
jgi:phosphoglycolate phosphatase-like HAD superfamily hydrolase